MRWLIAISMLCFALPAEAQNITGLVVSSCGVVPSQFKAGNPGSFTVDTTGALCMGSGGSVVAGPVNGVATSTGLVVSTCGNQTFKAGNPGPYTVDPNGNICK
jgi:hypothetical protein